MGTASAMLSTMSGYFGYSVSNGGSKTIITKYNNISGESWALNEAWCHMFLSLCASESGNGSIIPITASCATGYNWFKSRGRAHNRGSGYNPKAGDLVYYTWHGSTTNSFDHVGCVIANNSGMLTVREGNHNDCVSDRVVSTTDSTIIGFGNPAYSGGYTETPCGTTAQGLRVTASSLNVRSGPGLEYPIVGTLPQNSRIGISAKYIDSTNNRWYKYPDGWVSGMNLEGWIQEHNGKWWYVMQGWNYTKNNWQKIGSYWYFFDADGYMLENQWLNWNGKKYYLKNGGYMACNETLTLNGKKYKFDSSGALVS